MYRKKKWQQGLQKHNDFRRGVVKRPCLRIQYSYGIYRTKEPALSVSEGLEMPE